MPSLPSILVFGPQTSNLSSESLYSLRHALIFNPRLQPIRHEIEKLPGFWPLVVAADPELDCVPGVRYLEEFVRLVSYGEPPTPISGSNIPNTLITPLTVLLHVVQYLSYVDVAGETSHAEVLNHVSSRGGVRGFCTGLLSATAVASSLEEKDIFKWTGNALRLAVCIGAYIDADAYFQTPNNGYSCFVVKWSNEQGKNRIDEVMTEFPQAYVSVRTDLNTETITVSTEKIKDMCQSLNKKGLVTKPIATHGRFHSPTHKEAAHRLRALCSSTPILQFPRVSEMFISVLSTFQVSADSYMHDIIIDSILANICDWYNTLSEMSFQFTPAGERLCILQFGLIDCIPSSLVRSSHANVIRATSLDTRDVLMGGRTNSFTPDTAISGKDIAIVGMAGRFPGADNISQFWDLLCKGESQCELMPEERFRRLGLRRSPENKLSFYGNFVNDIDSFDHRFFKKSSREAASMDPQQRLLLEVAYQALESAEYFGHFGSGIPPNDIGCYVGVCASDYNDNVASHPPNAYSSLGTLRAFLTGKISHFFGWTGPSITFDTACSSSAVAIHTACKALQTGECSMALAGGVSLYTSPNFYQNLAAASFLSPTGPTKPFDASGDGYCRGEGAALVVLKRLTDAVADGDEILGVLSATAINQNENSTSITVPHAESQVRLYEKVVSEAGIQAHDVSFVEAHGTGTPVGDPIEFGSIRKVFGGAAREKTLYVSSVKGNIGHLEGASGAASLIKTILMMQHGMIPVQANHSRLNPKIAPLGTDCLAIPSETIPWDGNSKIACINNYGAAGSNAAMIIRNGPSATAARLQKTPLPKYPIFISANSVNSLQSYCDSLFNMINDLSSHYLDENVVAGIAFHLANQQNYQLPYTITGTVSSLPELKSLLSSNPAPQPLKKNLKPVLVFGGQTRTYVGLSRNLLDSAPLLRKYLDMCDRSLKSMSLQSIYPAIFHTETVSDVVLLHSLLFAIQYSSAKAFMDSGLQPAALVGHSFGQLTALCVSGVLSLEDGLRLVTGRASLMLKHWGFEKGSMISVRANINLIFRIIAAVDSTIEIACYNEENSHVLVGTEAAIDNVQRLLQENQEPFSNIKFKKLDVAYGFHSKFTDPLLTDLKQLAEDLTFKMPAIPFETCSTGETWTAVTADHIVEHTRTPVYFAEAIQRLSSQLGPCTWIEAGSDSSIIGMVRSVLKHSTENTFQGMNLTETTALSSLAEAIVKLWSVGHTIQFWPFDRLQRSSYMQLTLPPYQFEKSRHWLDWKDMVTESPKSDPTQASLLTIVNSFDPSKREAEFLINASSEDYRFFVEGHAVLAEPLCPAPLYIDLVGQAVKVLQGEQTISSLIVEDLEIFAPLGSRQSNISLTLKRANDHSQTWEFSLHSHIPEASTGSQCHATGRARILQDSNRLENDFARYESLLSPNRFERLLDEPQAEALQGGQVYKAFNRVVNYRPYYKGVQRVHACGREILGRVTLPAIENLDAEKKKMLSRTLAIDNFIQVAGLHVNCLSDVPDNQVWVCTKVDSFQSHIEIDGSSSWLVYSAYRPVGEKELVNDIFVFDAKSRLLVTIILGVQFSRVQISSLARALSRANQNPDALSTAAVFPTTVRKDSSKTYSTQTVMAVSKKSNKEEFNKPSLDILSMIRTVLRTVAEVSEADVREDATFEDLGIDSLMIAEVLSEINKAFHTSISTEDFAAMVDIASVVSAVQSLLGVETPGSNSDSDENASGIEFGTPATSSGATTPLELPILPSIPPDMVGKLESLLRTHLDNKDSITMGTNLADQGLDSLLCIELASDIKTTFGVDVDISKLNQESNFGDLVNLVFPSRSQGGATKSDIILGSTHHPTTNNSSSAIVREVFLEGSQKAFEEIRFNYDKFTKATGFADFWTKVYPTQARLVRAYVVEAFAQLGCDLKCLKAGELLPKITYLPSHEKLVAQLYNILRDGQLVATDASSQMVRTDQNIDSTPAKTILEQLNARSPQHASEHNLLHLTGSKLAECLTGATNALDILFRSKANKALLEEVYSRGPMYQAISQLLCSFLERAFNVSDPSIPFQILELGGGTGGTTRYVIDLLERHRIPFRYTFTDVSGALVAAARKKFAGKECMEFKVIDIEKLPAVDLRGKFHAIISTNCIHATRNLEISTSHMRQMLRPDGFVSLVEFTRNMYWFDLVFGLLDGWWFFEDGRSHVLASEWFWDTSMRRGGFQHVTWTDGPSPEARTLRIITGFNAPQENPSFTPERVPSDTGLKAETLLYQKKENVPLFADVYYPSKLPTRPMPIAIMIHGGGHVMLSRKDIRPKQTVHLHSLGFLPISIDYRLCPEKALCDGPMVDVCDALAWVQSDLSSINLLCPDININSSRIAVVGWSTGGHLAMTTAFTSLQRGLRPPTVILAFYCPSDYEDPSWQKPNYPESTQIASQIEYNLLEGVQDHPITAYNISASTRAVGGWMAPTDPRSRIILHMNWNGQFLPILLHGLPAQGQVNNETDTNLFHSQPQPSIEEIQTISPYAQIQNGVYKTPTYMVHGTEDDLIPWEQSERTANALREKGVHAELGIVEGKVHLFDIYPDVDGKAWEAVKKGYEFVAKEVFG